MEVHTRNRLFGIGACALAMFALSACAGKVVDSPGSSVTALPPAEAMPAPEVPGGPAQDVQTSELVPVFFRFDSYVLDEPARAALDRNARLLRDHPNLPVTIEGHCDERGTIEYNQALGERRAKAARDYLTAAGVDRARIQVISYGKERPFESGEGENAWSLNRRAHFLVP